MNQLKFKFYLNNSREARINIQGIDTKRLRSSKELLSLL